MSVTYPEDGEFNIFTLVIGQMEIAEKLLNITGEEKSLRVKHVVKISIIDKWGMDFYLKYEPFIPFIIEFVIIASRGFKTTINKKIRKCLW